MACILVIDDEPDVRALIKLMLTGTGHEVIPIVSTELAGVDLQNFDLVITDMIMPDIDGVGVIQSLRQRGLDVPVIAISGAPWKDEYGPLDVAARLGVQSVIAKPFHRSKLLELVNECLKNPAEAGRLNPAGRLA